MRFSPRKDYKNINVGCILMLEAPMSYANTRIAYRQFIERFGPDEFFSMKEWIDRNIESMGIQQILSFGDWAGMTPSFHSEREAHLESAAGCQ